MVRHLNVPLEDRELAKLSDAKDRAERREGREISWSDFLLEHLLIAYGAWETRNPPTKGTA